MKRFCLLLVVVAVGFISFSYGTTAHAANYETYCDASARGESDGGEGYTHAVVSGEDEHDSWLAESRVDGWELGAKSELQFNDYTKLYEGSYYAPSASADFKQQFLVTNGSFASTVTFAYDGTLSAAGSDNVVGMYEFGTDLSVNHYDGNGDWVEGKHDGYFRKGNGDGFGTWNYDDGFTITYAAGELGTGDNFFLGVDLWAFYEAEGVWFEGEGEPTYGHLHISADFYNSLRLVSVTGGIEPVGGPPVPIPAAVWLLGSGLLGLVAVRRRKKG